MRGDRESNPVEFAVVPVDSDNGPMVIPRDGAGSVRVRKLENNPPFGVRMPYLSAPMAPSEIQLIIDWIDQAARDN